MRFASALRSVVMRPFAAPSALPDCATSGRLRIDLRALSANYRRFQRLVAPANCAAVVKADGYGLGMVPVARALLAQGCDVFFVAQAQEGAALRRVARRARIYVLNGLPRRSAEFFAAHRLQPCLGSLAEIRDWCRQARRMGAPLPAALHIDTGMNRLGLSQAECAKLAARPALLAGLDLSLVMSHLACADEGGAKQRMNAQQRTRFLRLAAQLPPAPLSLANSAGTGLGARYHLDMVRVGIGLYGGGRRLPFVPRAVVQLRTHILAVRQIARGETVGYGAAWRAPAAARVALVPLGYADGYMRQLGRARPPFAVGFVRGRAVPVIGRVSMDISALNVSQLPIGAVRRGTAVEFWSGHEALEAQARLAGTISYELLTRLGQRYKRVYVTG